MFGSYYGRSNFQREVDYMDVLKPHFDLSRVSSKSSSHNAIAAIKRAKHDTSMEDVAVHTTLASGLATQAKLATETNTKQVMLETHKKGECVECGNSVVYFCKDCADEFCYTCYQQNHRKGKRTMHKFDQVGDLPSDLVMKDDDDSASPKGSNKTGLLSSLGNMLKGGNKNTSKVNSFSDHQGEWWAGKSLSQDWFVERAKYIPLRLTHEERRILRVVEGILKASKYVDKVDQRAFKNKKDRIRKIGQEIIGVLQGLVASSDINRARELSDDGDFAKYAEFYQNIFEVARRHKIRNPEKMRSIYPVMMCFLQDTQLPEIQEFFGFSCVRPIRTVYSLLEEINGLDLLRDPQLAVATQIIITDNKTKGQVQNISDIKYKALKQLLEKYGGGSLSKETIRMCVSSIGDNHYYLQANRDPCNTMQQHLAEEFHPTTFKSADTCLTIADGKEGSRLSHDHATQYAYVLQSLCLWRDQLDDFFRLWCLAEQDQLSSAKSYELVETGQGVHRLQPAPNTDRAVREIVYKVQVKCNNWVGSSVIHMGDRNVPNALLFIDKYNQIGKIQNPICIVLRNMGKLIDAHDDKHTKATRQVVEKYLKLHYKTSMHNVKLDILKDFFTHAFDGSGSDNFFEAGSCIDGRLTSTWDWCNTITNKKYHPIFLMTDFVGFDGVEWD